MSRHHKRCVACSPGSAYSVDPGQQPLAARLLELIFLTMSEQINGKYQQA
jgi:hypothetical protein